MPTISGLSTQVSALTALQQNFKKTDTDGNGSISATEFEAAAKATAGLKGADGLSSAALFKKLDTDNNGGITQTELTQGINLSTQVQSVLIQGQELQNNFLSLLGASSASGTSNLTSTLLGGSSSLFGSNTDYSDLTTSLLGGTSTSLTTLISGANANTGTLAGLLGGNSTATTNALLQQYLTRYADTATL
jgi:hypothetical protein